jgi:hypothetical protein
MTRKMVLLQTHIMVPTGANCYFDMNCCDAFNNYDTPGLPQCNRGIGRPIKIGDYHYRKPQKCMELERV